MSKLRSILLELLDLIGKEEYLVKGLRCVNVKLKLCQTLLEQYAFITWKSMVKHKKKGKNDMFPQANNKMKSLRVPS